MTGRSDTPLPSGWDDIPGARGCTPQSCAFRDLYSEFQQCKATLYGISTQHSEEQAEAKNRLHLPYELLSDEKLQLKNALALPTPPGGSDSSSSIFPPRLHEGNMQYINNAL